MTLKTIIKNWRKKHNFQMDAYNALFEDFEKTIIKYLKRNTKLK